MNQTGPRKPFNALVKAYERFLTPYPVMDQNGDDAHRDPKKLVSRIDNVLKQPYTYAYWLPFLLETALVARKGPAELAAQAVFGTTLCLVQVAISRVFLQKNAHRSYPAYYVDSTQKAKEIPAPQVLLDNLLRLRAARIRAVTAPLGIALVGGVMNLALGSHGWASTLSMMAACVIMAAQENQRAEKILTGQWMTMLEKPKPQTKTVKVKEPKKAWAPGPWAPAPTPVRARL